MPTPETDALGSASGPDQQDIACSPPLTPPPDGSTPDTAVVTHSTRYHCLAGQEKDNEDATMIGSVADNTATGMSLSQEDSMYTSASPIGDRNPQDGVPGKDPCDSATPQIVPDNRRPSDKDSIQPAIHLTQHIPSTPPSLLGDPESPQHTDNILPRDSLPSPSLTESDDASQGEARINAFQVNTSAQTATRNSVQPSITPVSWKSKVDEELNHPSDTQPWDFSDKRIIPRYPSALLQPYAKFAGTQHSDHQVYNVEVTILTVDMEQSSMSGYLEICGLTPDHPTLTTFFTGEIIGGPDQKYSFRTKDPSWGASDKTDITHWVKFPEWRPLAPHAKRNINFVYPLDGQGWWQQDHIFMRWKEHFLVPDYKLRSIQGASFEGFYYICFNQVEGRISGMYFHSKSEKYQQLELKHEGQRGVWGRGVTPSIEFR